MKEITQAKHKTKLLDGVERNVLSLVKKVLDARGARNRRAEAYFDVRWSGACSEPARSFSHSRARFLFTDGFQQSFGRWAFFNGLLMLAFGAPWFLVLV